MKIGGTGPTIVDSMRESARQILKGRITGPVVYYHSNRVNSLEKDRQSLISNYQDKVSISRTGRLLHLNIRGKDKNKEAEKAARSWGHILKGNGGNADPRLKLLDKHISFIGNMMERMKNIAETAQDITLSKEDRLALQIDMCRLQHELDFQSELTLLKMNPDLKPCEAEGIAIRNHGIFEYSDAYKMLERALKRIENGEEWDVAEVLTPIIEFQAASPDMPEASTIIYDGSTSVTTEDLPILLRTEWEITNDETVPTVSELLKAKGRSVMDAGAAALTAEELEKDLTALAEKRERMIAFIDEEGVNPEPGMKERFEKKLIILLNGINNFLYSISRDSTQTMVGPPKDEQGNVLNYEQDTSDNSNSVSATRYLVYA
ncbi:MAG: hypothetical protein LBS35_04125 [Synergistaceae bacterium]|nr:hypothetical protein [Synergistaceae bacterium]